MFNDLRFALRMLFKNPGFTAVVVLTLALGIGGTTAIFSVVYGALRDPFPFTDSQRLAVLVSRDMTHGQHSLWAAVSAPEFLDYREQNHVFDEVLGGAYEGVLLTGSGAAQDFDGCRVTTKTFRVLGVPPLLGRVLTDEDGKSGAPPVVVLSHKVWQSKFGGNAGILSRTVIINHQLTTVVGVMPPRFWFQEADMWLPTALSRGRAIGQPETFTLIGHLTPGVTIEQANADVAVLAKRFAAVYPKDHPKEMTFAVEPLPRAVTGGGWGFERETMYLLLGAIGLLLVIACVNVANLLLARATAREREFAIRASLGANRGRLVRQLLIESFLLALGGAVLGCLLAWDGLAGLVAIFPPWYIPSEAVVRINGPVLLFTLGAALLSTLLFGLAPALLVVRKDPQATLKASVRGAGESLGHNKLRNLLVVSEVTLSLVLLSGAGLLIRSFFALRNAEMGYNPDNVLMTSLTLPAERYKTAEQKNQFHRELLRRIRALPGVVSAALSSPSMPMGWDCPLQIAGTASAENQSAVLRLSGDRFFETMGIRLLQGRTISEEDCVHARKVVVINRAFVSKYFQTENPLGQQIKVNPSRLGWGIDMIQQEWFEIVGVVADTRHMGSPAGPTIQPTVFVPYTAGGISYSALVVRTTTDPARWLNSVRQESAGIDKELSVGVGSLRDELEFSWFTEPRFVLTMLIAFASLGLVLVSVGVYSVLSYAVSRRTQEIGIRMALGAQATDVRHMIILSGLRWLLVGIGIGIPASIALAKILQNRIWGIKSADPLTLLAVSLLLTVVGLAACYFPARRATKVDPMVALRYE